MEASISVAVFTERLARLGIIVLAVCAISIGPIIFTGQLTNLMGRLFPFKRGLSHSYWAANVWALYAFLDRILVVCTLFSAYTNNL